MSLRDESCLVEDQDPQHEEVPDSVGQDVSHHLKFSLPEQHTLRVQPLLDESETQSLSRIQLFATSHGNLQARILE